MPIQLFRVDDRLIHGQVVVGWGNKLAPDRYVVVDDELMASDWERQLYELGAPEDAEVQFVTVKDARSALQGWSASELKTVVLLRDTESLGRLGAEGLLEGREINLGGMHHRPGSEQVLPYIFMDEADRARLRALAASGAEITARDLPGTKPVSLSRLLGEVGP